MPRSTRRSRPLAAALVAMFFATAAHAQVVWTDWTSSPTSTTVVGTMTFGSTTVGVTYTGPINFTQFSCSGAIESYNPATTYAPNAPTNCEMISLATGGAKTLTFSQAVTNPYFALVSWNIPSLTFGAGTTVQVVNSGPGTYGSGTMTAAGNVVNFSGEAHGTIRLLGNYTSITFTDSDENWHGFTVGATGLAAASTVPEPSTYALMGSGLLALAGFARRRRSR